MSDSKSACVSYVLLFKDYLRMLRLNTVSQEEMDRHNDRMLIWWEKMDESDRDEIRKITESGDNYYLQQSAIESLLNKLICTDDA